MNLPKYSPDTGKYSKETNSYENLVFKYLRRNGYIEKLFNFQIDKFDKELSLKEIKNNLKY